MVKEFQKRKYWALILGGSSGLGLATAKKLASHGYNICIVHRNRRSEMTAIENEFDIIKNENVQFLSFNIDAFKVDQRLELIQ